MARLTKEQRRIYRNDLIPCKCGNADVFVAWKWVHGCPNVRHYAVVCECRQYQYQWRKSADSAIEAWNRRIE